jgi:hypothetical protein
MEQPPLQFGLKAIFTATTIAAVGLAAYRVAPFFLTQSALAVLQPAAYLAGILCLVLLLWTVAAAIVAIFRVCDWAWNICRFDFLRRPERR